MVGVQFEDRQEIIKEIVIDCGVNEFLLIREPDNVYDKNAVSVEASGLKIGYLPQDLTKKIAPQMAYGKYYPAFLLKLNTHPYYETVGLTVRLNLPNINTNIV